MLAVDCHEGSISRHQEETFVLDIRSVFQIANIIHLILGKRYVDVLAVLRYEDAADTDQLNEQLPNSDMGPTSICHLPMVEPSDCLAPDRSTMPSERSLASQCGSLFHDNVDAVSPREWPLTGRSRELATGRHNGPRI
jgi:hypothetical protein